MTQYAICSLSVIPGRAQASDRAELTTQILFGEIVKHIEEQPNWLLVETLHDSYRCWVDKKQLLPIEMEWVKKAQENPLRRTNTFPSYLINNKKERILLPLGAALPLMVEDQLNWGNLQFDFENAPAFEEETASFHQVKKTAEKLMHVPYLWGGRSHFGIDCSGFIQLVFLVHNITLPRDSSQQVKCGTQVDFAVREKGDLAFFKNDEEKVTHVGLLLEDSTIIHASGKVRQDTFDEKGIVNAESGKRTHVLHSIRRVLS